MTVRQVLTVPKGEIYFLYPEGLSASAIDKRFETLRVERRGLRLWDSFEENPEYLEEYMNRPVRSPPGWKPMILDGWSRAAISETLMLNQYQTTMIQRVNIALQSSLPNTAIIGEAGRFSSYGTDNSRQDTETQIAPDLLVVHGNPKKFAVFRESVESVIVVGEAKLTQPDGTKDSKLIPTTQGCYESYLAQAVQYCVDLDLRFGFVLTNLDLVIFQLIRVDMTRTDRINTRSSHMSSPSGVSAALPKAKEGLYSSPMRRQASDWVEFTMGDAELLPVTAASDVEEQRQRIAFTAPMDFVSPVSSQYDTSDDVHIEPALMTENYAQAQRLTASQPRTPHRSERITLATQPQTPSPYRYCSLTTQPRTPCPNAHAMATPTPQRRFPELEAQHDSQDSQGSQGANTIASDLSEYMGSDYKPDLRSEDPTHVLIRSYDVEEEDVALRLFQLIMLAKRAQHFGLLKIGPSKVSFSALDSLAWVAATSAGVSHMLS